VSALGLVLVVVVILLLVGGLVPGVTGRVGYGPVGLGGVLLVVLLILVLTGRL
jgi:hypothetical protein